MNFQTSLFDTATVTSLSIEKVGDNHVFVPQDFNDTSSNISGFDIYSLIFPNSLDL